jgi:hypothetical protein
MTDETRYVKPSLIVRGTRSKYVTDEVLPVIGQLFSLFEVDIDAGYWVVSKYLKALR